MPVDEIVIGAEEKMEKAVKVLEEHFNGLRTGRANSALVENIKVQYYGNPTPLKSMANITILGAQMIVIKPYDVSVLKDVEKAVLASQLGITPQNDGKVIRLAIPPLSEERRKQLAARARELAEEAKISIRNVRRDANKSIEAEEKDKSFHLSEDDAFAGKEEVQELTKKYEGRVEELLDKKVKEITEI